MHGRIEFDHVRPHGLDEESRLYLFQISGIVGRMGRLSLKSVGYMKLLTRLKMLVNRRRLDRYFLLLIGKVVLSRGMVRCAVMLKVFCLRVRIPPGDRHHSHVQLLLLVLLWCIAMMVLTVLVDRGGLGSDRQVRALTPKR